MMAIVVIEILMLGAFLGGLAMFFNLKKNPKSLTASLCGAVSGFTRFVFQIILFAGFLFLLLTFIAKMG